MMDKNKKREEQEKLRIKIYNPDDEEKVFEDEGVDNAGHLIYRYNGKYFTGIIEHYINGVLVGEEGYIDGHVGGVQREYYENGQIKEEYYEYHAKPHGDFKIWDENGNLIRHSVYENGNRLKIIVE